MTTLDDLARKHFDAVVAAVTKHYEAALANLAIDAKLAEDERDRLRGVVARVEKLHHPWTLYGECDCELPERADALEVVTGHLYISDIGWTCNALYVACAECCTDGEFQTEDCACYHAHGPDVPICSTIAALAAP